MSRFRDLARTRSLVLVVATCATLLLVVSAGSAATSQRTAADDSASLTIAMPAVNIILSPAYLAQVLGYYAKRGLTVNIISNLGANAANYVVSGQADLAPAGAQPMSAAKQGKPITMIYSCCASGATGMLVGAKGITSVQQLVGKKIGTIGVGTAGYGAASIYNKKFNLNADLVPYANLNAAAAALAAGQIQGAAAAYDAWAALIQSGAANVLIDTRTKTGRQTVGVSGLSDALYFGLTDNLNSKRSAVIAWLWAYNRAAIWLKTHTPEQVAAQLEKVDVYQSIAPAVLLDTIASDKQYVAPASGYFPSTHWAALMNYWTAFGTPTAFNTGDPAFSYANRVDMSYLKSALQRNANYKVIPICKKGQSPTKRNPCVRFAK